MKATLVLALAGALAILAGCERERAKSGPAKPAQPAERQWSDEEMANDPEGYLKWADSQLASQVRKREEHLASLVATRREIADRRAKFVGEYEAISNLESRLGTATRRAEEEDRWPVSLAGQSFSKERAEAILAEAKQFLAERKALAASYDGATTKVDAAERSLREDVSRLSTLREKVAADLIGLRADRSNPQMDKLRKTEAEIAHYSKVLTSFAEVNVQTLAKDLPKPKHSVELQSLLN